MTERKEGGRVGEGEKQRDIETRETGERTREKERDQ